MPAVAGGPLADRLAALLPDAGTRLALLPRSDDTLAPVLEARGFQVAAVESADDLVPKAPSLEGWEAVLWLADEHRPIEMAILLESLRGVLAERGQLWIAGQLDKSDAAGALDPRVLTIALSEHGYVVTKQQPLADGTGSSGRELWTARRDSFRVREYRPGDETQILPIFEGSFFVRRSLDRWSWAYRENPYSNLQISEAFAENGQLVAHYAGFPVRFRLPDRAAAVTALHIGDTMTLPGVRHVGRGATSLLGRTVRHFYARFCDGRVAFNYGVNTGNIQRFSMSFVRAQRLEGLPFHVLPLPGPGLTVEESRWSRALPKRLRAWQCEIVEGFDASFDDFFARVAPDYGMLVERDARYLEWRYRRHPEGVYRTYACRRRGRLAGWATFRRRGDALVWGDGLVDRRYPEALRRLLAFALAQPEHADVARVETWATARPGWWRPLLHGLGFEERPEPQGLGLVFVPFEIDPGEAMRASFFYTMGDTDLF